MLTKSCTRSSLFVDWFGNEDGARIHLTSLDLPAFEPPEGGAIGDTYAASRNAKFHVDISKRKC